MGQVGPMKGVTEQLTAVRDRERRAEVGEPPLQNLMVADAGPETR